MTLPQTPWAAPAREVLDALEVDPARGLDAAELRHRRRVYGPNHLRRPAVKSAWVVLVAQLASPLVALLALAGVAAAVLGQVVEAVAIAVVIALNALIGFVTELSAVRAMEALTRLGSRRARVRREGVEHVVTARGLMPGDIVLLEAGDVVSADVRLIEASKLLVDESILTGESLPVVKGVEPVAADAPLAERRSALFKGTWLTRGAACGVVVATGMQTELGRIASLAAAVEDESTPLERRLQRLSHRLIGLVVLVAGLVVVSGLWTGRGLLLLVETAIALAVSAVPEGLPIIATIALARGMRRMARKNALVRRLSAVETLGGTNVIIVDKTGTLTENRMRVTRLMTDEGAVEPADPRARVLLEVGVLCNDAALDEDGDAGIGDPLEVALLLAGAGAGLVRAELVAAEPELDEVAFDPATKRMATLHRASDGATRVAVKGAPEAVLPLTTLDAAARIAWAERAHEMAAEGLRVLALAESRRPEPAARADPFAALALVGLVGLEDPPRVDVAEAIAACRSAGIRVVMATGDHPRTAAAIARAVGIVTDDEDDEVVVGDALRPVAELTAEEAQRLRGARVLARSSPEQKLHLIALHQAAGSIVAMTGDGVNDAPALRKADIGVAMGGRGTEVARESAEMVLSDDAFGTIVLAVREGRAIFRNIRQFVVYLMSCNLSEIFVIAIAAPLGTPLPVLPLQILFLNLVTDVLPSLALGASEGPEGLMRRPPRDPREPIVGAVEWRRIFGFAALMTVAVLGALLLALYWLELDARRAVTVSFLTLAVAQTLHVFDMRSASGSLLRNEVVANRWVWAAVASCLGLCWLAVAWPPLAAVLQTAPPGAAGLALVAAAGSLPLLIGQLWLWRRGVAVRAAATR